MRHTKVFHLWAQASALGMMGLAAANLGAQPRSAFQIPAPNVTVLGSTSPPPSGNVTLLGSTNPLPGALPTPPSEGQFQVASPAFPNSPNEGPNRIASRQDQMETEIPTPTGPGGGGSFGSSIPSVSAGGASPIAINTAANPVAPFLGASVQDPEGLIIGSFNNVLVNQQGGIEFALINVPSGRLAVVPWSLLQPRQNTSGVVTSGTRGLVTSVPRDFILEAPAFTQAEIPALAQNTTQLGQIYSFFGLQPPAINTALGSSGTPTGTTTGTGAGGGTDQTVNQDALGRTGLIGTTGALTNSAGSLGAPAGQGVFTPGGTVTPFIQQNTGNGAVVPPISSPTTGTGTANGSLLLAPEIPLSTPGSVPGAPPAATGGTTGTGTVPSGIGNTGNSGIAAPPEIPLSTPGSVPGAPGPVNPGAATGAGGGIAAPPPIPPSVPAGR